MSARIMPLAFTREGVNVSAEFIVPDGLDGWAVVKRMVYLAWKASRVAGLGVFQDRGPDQTEEQIWASMYGRTDYPGGNALSQANKPGDVYADYVHGRCMKLGLSWGDGKVSVRPTYGWRNDCQTFRHAYPAPQSLFDAAVAELTQE